METTQTTQPVVETVTQPAEPEKDAASGKFVYKFASVDADGQPKEYKYLYTDHKDLADQLVDAKKHGDQYIHEVKSGKRQLTPATHKDFTPVAATSEEEKTRREQYRKDFESELGGSMDDVRKQLVEARQIREYTIMNQWALNKQAEGYVFCPENGKAMAKFLEGDNPEKKPLDQANVRNLELAFETLKESGKLKLDNSTTETSSSTTDKTNSSSGSNDGDTQSKSKPTATGVKPGTFEGGAPRSQSSDSQPLTAKRYREINLMSLAEFKKLERTNRKEYDGFVQMKQGKSSQA